MINPTSLITLDSIKDENGEVLHIGNMGDDFEFEEYDLSNPKDFTKYISDVKVCVRSSIEYKNLIKYLKDFGMMNRSGLNPNISNDLNESGKKLSIEIHHTPFTLEDIAKIIYDKRSMKNENLSIEMVAKEVMMCHYMNLVGLFPLTKTEHELVHNGYMFIPVNYIYGDYKMFMNIYNDYIDDDTKETIASIEELSKDFDIQSQNRIISQSNIYIEPTSYTIPQFDSIKDIMVNRLDTIKNNMYTLPILKQEDVTTSSPKPVMKEAIIFCNKEDG